MKKSIIALPLLLVVTGCNARDEGNGTTVISVDQNRVDQGIAAAGNAASEAADKAANAIDNAGPTLENTADTIETRANRVADRASNAVDRADVRVDVDANTADSRKR